MKKVLIVLCMALCVVLIVLLCPTPKKAAPATESSRLAKVFTNTEQMKRADKDIMLAGLNQQRMDKK